MLTKKDFEVTDPQEFLFIDHAGIEQVGDKFSDEINEIADAQEAGIYDSQTTGIIALESFKKLFSPIYFGIIILFQLLILWPIEIYIYIARKFFKHNFSQNFRKKYLNNAQKSFAKLPQLMLNSGSISKESYDLRMQKLDKYMKYYEWETFEK